MRSLLVLPVLALLALPAPGADMTKLTVQVTSADTGKPVDRASVVVRFVEGRSYIKLGKKIRTTWELRTSQEGSVNIPEIPQGKILVQIIAKGYQTFGGTFEVQEEQKTLEIKLNSPQKQFSAHEPQP
jgi:hypothetical protein